MSEDDLRAAFGFLTFIAAMLLAIGVIVHLQDSGPVPIEYTCNPGHHRTIAECP